MADIITAELVSLDTALGMTKDEVVVRLTQLVVDAGRATSPEGLARDVFAREAKSSTGMPGGLAIPHCRSEHATEATLVFARLAEPVDFGAKDGPADLVFLIAAPAAGDQDHLKLLTKLARALVRKDFTDALRSATQPAEVVELVSGVMATTPAKTGTATGATAAPPATAGGPLATAEGRPATTSEPLPAPSRGGAGRHLVAVTSCPTGIAHTYMAAEALEAAGTRAGVPVHVEPQGSAGAEPLDAEVIRTASAVIFATDVGVRNKGRFAGLPEINDSVKGGIHNADRLVARALEAADDPQAPRVASSGDAGDGRGGAGAAIGGASGMTGGLGTKLRTALLTGVSYMIPFVAAGGLLIALGFLLGGYQVDPTFATANSLSDLPTGPLVDGALFNSSLLLYLGAVCLFIGKAAFALFVPALAGYIAYAIADRPGIAPGFVVGLICGGGGAVGGLDGVGAGFIGAIIGGLMAGVVALWIARLKVPRFVRGLMPVVIIPLFATIITSGLMVVVLGRPLAWVTEKLTDALGGMSGTSVVLLGIVLGLMMCFDLGGPVNKAAYVFATTGLGADPSPANLRIMAAVMLAGMVPPLALALASTVRPRLFTKPEQENGRAAWLLGASFISEGAIPFAAADPLRVIPSMMAGGAVTGALAMAFDVQLRAPHGGIFVLFAVNGVAWFLLSLLIGTVIAALVVVTLKQLRGDPLAAAAETADTGALVSA